METSGASGCKIREIKGSRRAYLDRRRSVRAPGTTAGWTAETFRLGQHAEAFGAELAALVKSLSLIEDRGDSGGCYRIFADSQAAMRRIVSDAPGPGQHLAILGIRIALSTQARGSHVDIHWVPGHAGVEGNEQADQHARAAASCGGGLPAIATANARGDFVSQAHLKSRGTSRATGEWRRDVRTRNRGGKVRMDRYG